ncbi:hypothetical protein [Methylobacterium sp. CM6257]
MIDDAKFKIAAPISLPRKLAVESNVRVRVVGIPDDPEIAARDLCRLYTHVSPRRCRAGGGHDEHQVQSMAFARRAHGISRYIPSRHNATGCGFRNNFANRFDVENTVSDAAHPNWVFGPIGPRNMGPASAFEAAI